MFSPVDDMLQFSLISADLDANQAFDWCSGGWIVLWNGQGCVLWEPGTLNVVIRRFLLIYEKGRHCYHSERGWYDITDRGVEEFEVSNEIFNPSSTAVMLGNKVDTWVPFWLRK